jgi:hypothetical protein
VFKVTSEEKEPVPAQEVELGTLILHISSLVFQKSVYCRGHILCRG